MTNNLKFSHYPPSKLAFGCELLGGVDWGKYDLNAVKKAINYAYDLGITTFDTADVYGLGRSEIELSKTLGKKRHKAFIISKFGLKWSTSNKKNERAIIKNDCSSAHMKFALENTLKRLRIEALPLYLVHWPDKSTPIEKVCHALENFVKEGKILNYGISNFNKQDISIISKNSNIKAIEDSFNLKDFKDKKCNFETAKKHKLYTFSYGPLAQGLLTGKYSGKHKFKSNDRRYRLKHFQSSAWGNNNILLNKISIIAQKYNRNFSEVPIRWIIDYGLVDTVIFGAKNITHVDQISSCLKWQLSNQDLNYLSGFDHDI
tara:strand:- start:57 stop:1007 length:951 start_codon:yes stop_codon:yes gene_type:complete